MTSVLLLAVLAVPPPQADVPRHSFRDKANISLGIVSVVMSGTAAGLTAGCIAEGTCREVNPLLRRAYAKDVVIGTTVKVLVAGAVHYLVWKIPEGSAFMRRAKTGLLVFLAAFNSWDAVHDMRVVRNLSGK